MFKKLRSTRIIDKISNKLAEMRESEIDGMKRRGKGNAVLSRRTTTNYLLNRVNLVYLRRFVLFEPTRDRVAR